MAQNSRCKRSTTFLGLNNFTDLVAPLNQLRCSKWIEVCNKAFESTMKPLTQLLVLVFPCFDKQAGTMILQTDDSAGRPIGALLEHEGLLATKQVKCAKIADVILDFVTRGNG